jgi:hypothetical protein
MVVSWASPGPAVRPRVRIGQRVIAAEPRPYTGGRGDTVWTYHAPIGGLRPGATYAYLVTADNDANAADPFSATFRTAPAGRAAFRFTSNGDEPNAYAVDAVESFQPLFHLLDGDLCDADRYPGDRPEAWRVFGNLSQASAANRPWMPCLSHHDAGPGHVPPGLSSYLTRYTLPDNRTPSFAGHWYSFRVGSVLIVSLDAGGVPPESGAALATGAQAGWLERTLAAGRHDPAVDWIVAHMHQGARLRWQPLFDRYQVDLVVSGPDDGGIAVFDVSPDPADLPGQTSITVTRYRAAGAPASANPDYAEFETFTLIRPRR